MSVLYHNFPTRHELPLLVPSPLSASSVKLSSLELPEIMPDQEELERAISRVLASERQDINPLYSEALNQTAKTFHIIENIPRDYDALTEMIKQREAAIDHEEDCFDIDALDTERQALERLCDIVMYWQRGRDLDSIAY